MIKKSTMLMLAVVLVMAVLSACGTTSNNGGNTGKENKGNQGEKAGQSNKGEKGDQGDKASQSSQSSQDVKKIVIGTGTQFPQVCFIDQDGKLTGFDVELLKLIDEKLPQYEFEFQTADLTNLLLGLKSNKIDLVAHQLEKNAEREAEYLFNKTPYAYWKSKVVVAKTNNDPIQSLDDMKSKKAIVTSNSAAALLLEKYNKANNDAIEIVYQSGAANDLISQITTGRVDFMIAPDFTLGLVDQAGLLKTVGNPLSETEIHYALRKDDPETQALSDAIDQVLQELRKDGTLSALSQEWLKFDATVQE